MITVKVRMQTASYNGPIDCLKQLLAKEGPKAMFKGMWVHPNDDDDDNTEVESEWTWYSSLDPSHVYATQVNSYRISHFCECYCLYFL